MRSQFMYQACQLRAQFPAATITHNGGVRWIGGILYEDDLCLISTDARELQRMINVSDLPQRP